ncbi:MAG: prolipoprotein diacylglyceryl transferase [Candidatus Scatomorpha sp.]|jgi:phosphatidylglycerol:prolipoprotein diacylglycerol transferase
MPTMIRDAAISFPMLGGLALDFPASFELFGHTFYLYGVVMAIAFIAAVFYASKKAPRVGIKGDDIFGLVLWVLPIAIVGCRVYYVIAEWDRYKDNFWDVFKIWEGGIAMYGGTIAGVITVIVWSHVKKIRFGATLDVASSGLILGQVIGRWANFVNREAFGRQTDIFCRMGLTTPDGTTYYVHPTFLYESLWNLIGFIIIDRYWYRKNHRKYDGQIFIFYVFWYGAGRAWVEGLRTDSLYIPGTNIRTSQLLAAVSALVALVILLVNIKRPHKPTYVSTLEAAAAAGAENVSEAEAEATTETETAESTETETGTGDEAGAAPDTTEKTEENKND